MNFNTVYTTATATPFDFNETYIEIEPCEELKPYIRCFWGSKKPYRKKKTDTPSQGLIIPDTCMDIIFDINFTENRIDNTFCTIDEKAYSLHYENNKEEIVSTFAIRFYAWSTIFFTEESLKDTKNSNYRVECFFSKLKNEIEPKLFDITNINERVVLAQNFLLKNICLKRQNSIINNAVAEMLLNKGNIKTENLAKTVFTSRRQLERLFNENIGVTPKKLSSLIRYQYLWQDILLSKDINLLDLTERYGYSDQAHLLNDFRNFHSMSVSQAKENAYKNVAFLQYKQKNILYNSIKDNNF